MLTPTYKVVIKPEAALVAQIASIHKAVTLALKLVDDPEFRQWTAPLEMQLRMIELLQTAMFRHFKCTEAIE